MILVDSSVWIAYFKGDAKALPLNELIDVNAICINDLILTELIPAILHKKEFALKDTLLAVAKVDLDIDWPALSEMQTLNLANGINNVGIADLIIAQNAMAHQLELFTFDSHFKLLAGIHPLRLYPPSLA